MFRRFSLHVVLTLVVLFAGQTQATAQEAHAVFERLQTTYDQIDALQATFTQTMQASYSDQVERMTGTLVMRGDQYRVEMTAQTFVTDGTVSWVYLADQNQVIVNDYVEDETTFSLSTFFDTYDERYDITQTERVQVNGESHFLLQLQPKDASAFFREVRVWMRDRDNLVTQMEITDMADTILTYQLDDIELNPSLPSDVFRFSPPDGAELIDLRS